jgi:hypothetical protein
MTELFNVVSGAFGELPLLSQVGFVSGAAFGVMFLAKRKTELALLGWVSVVYGCVPMLGKIMNLIF